MAKLNRGRHLDDVAAKSLDVLLAKKYPNKDKFLSPSVVGEFMGVSSEAVKQWIYNGRLPAAKLSNGYWKIKVRDLEQFLKAKYDIHRKVLVLAKPAVSEVVVSLGFMPVNVSSYADGIVKAIDSPPALLVADTAIPDCWKLAEKIRETKVVRNVPIVLLGTLSDAEVDRALALRIQSVIALTGEVGLEMKRILG